MTALSRTRNYVSRMYTGPRLTTSILLLGVVGLMMYNAGDPRNWKWLEDLSPEPAAATAQPLLSADKKATIRYDDTSKDYDPTGVKADDPTNANFHWDEDPDEKDELAKEFQVVIDGTTEIQPEEMFSYSRLLRWVKTRAYQDLLPASRSEWTFNDLMQAPLKHRGELLRLPLNVVRILPYDFTDPTTKEKRKIYEVWGWSAKSSSWLYVALVPELPAGMPEGVSIKERATLVGYFFKLQGYLEAKAKPRSAPLKAPLLIGRLVWEPTTREVAPPPRLEWKQEWTWWGLGTLFIAYLGVRSWLSLGKRKTNSASEQLDAKDEEIIGAWLEHPESSNFDEQTIEDSTTKTEPLASRFAPPTSEAN